MSDQTPVDWAGIEVAYKAGQSSLREIGRQFDVSDTAIRKRAKAEGWARPLGAKVREAVGEALVRASGSQPSSQCEPRTVGRPTKYDPSYCDKVEEDMAAGYSLTAFAGLIGVNRATLTEWAAAHPEFSAAVSRGKAARLRNWETVALSMRTNGGGPGGATVTVFGLKNMGGDEWSDTSKQEVTSTVTVKADADDAFLAVARLVGGAAAGAPSRAGDDGAMAGGGAA